MLKFWNQLVKFEHLACLFSTLVYNGKSVSVGPIGIKCKNNVRPMVTFDEKSGCSMFICTSPIFAIYSAWFLIQVFWNSLN